MPWNPAQHRLFEAAAHDPRIAASSGIKQPDAARMASEGIKPAPVSHATETRKKMLVKMLNGG